MKNPQIQRPEKLIFRKPQDTRRTMKTVTLTPNSSAKSSTTVDCNLSHTETRDSSYYPGCRKDANCNCTICIESINATLDLIPKSNRRSSVTISSSRPTLRRSPVSFNPSLSADLSTPEMSARVRPVTLSTHLNSTPRMNFQEKAKSRKGDLNYGVSVVRIFLGLMLVSGLEYGFSHLVSGVLRARFSPDAAKKLVEKSMAFEDLNGRFVLVKDELEQLVGEEVSNCSSIGSVWKISKDGLLLNTRCMMYESMTEEVSIWGWPQQTAGLLTAEYSSRSFSIISGRVTEWSNVEAKYFVRKVNSSWTQGKWSSSVVQFDPNTWILEYRPSFLVDSRRPISALLELLKFRLTREFKKLKQEFWLLSSLVYRHLYFAEKRIPIPT